MKKSLTYIINKMGKMNIIKTLANLFMNYCRIENDKIVQRKKDLRENTLPQTLLNHYRENIVEMEFKRDTGIIANQQVIKKLNSLYRDLSKVSKITWKEIKSFYEFIDCSGKKAEIRIPFCQKYLGMFLYYLSIAGIFFCMIPLILLFYLNFLDVKIIIEFSLYIFYFIYFFKMSLPVKEAMRFQKLIQKQNI
ncbi:hypothetical protein JNB19_03005 [Capnocytophaga genosp. AHN8471]|uniref:Uncharacterized protein n=2 Tax=Capnocytophaga genosp. AHN8471 TaxID=327574 RepID=A0ABS1YUM7_9FLAO|nr:hypothetical protein [Capnocytophaga genosp. AHN8471]MBM0649730.1 hypothetical protein [Capnocytophaga genosp. AHN8471]